ncbi:MAG TPA: ABC-F family ATP-binding cassette domain-containing protein [Virgibacillus sp.]|nr:ABC-F family ATP-binding cassette domain-containing protein [Virgibacillus sp.]
MLTIENLTKSYGTKELFSNVSCHIQKHDRIGLIGVNGTGKSTFLKTIAGLDTPSTGVFNHAKSYKIVYLHQEPELEQNVTVLEEIYQGDSPVMHLMRKYEEALLTLEQKATDPAAQAKLLNVQQEMDEQDAWEANTTAKTILTKLGITAFNQKIHELSGGQQKRVALAKALIQPADLLLLDEPTNHLDNETIEWLEKYLSHYNGALLVVTHDRYFLNRVTNRIYELDKGHLYTYEGNYAFFLEKKTEREALEREEERKHANALRRELAWLNRGPRARSTKQKAHVERVRDLQEQTFDTTEETISFEAASARLGKQVIELEGVSKSFHNEPIVSGFDFLLVPGDRLGIIGPNGVGKTTLLNIMAKRIQPDTGNIRIGETVRIGYYTQGEEELDDALRVIDYIKEVAEVITTKDGQVITAEQMLERFLFSRDEQWTYIRRLSGGEKRRLYLLKILMTEPNVLFLDEPTNDLDTQTLGVLEEYLEHFPGVVVTVSHDRYFLDRVVHHLLVFQGGGHVRHFYGNYHDYLDEQHTMSRKQKERTKERDEETEKRQFETSQPKKLSYKEQKEWETIEEDIMQLEEDIESLQNEVNQAGSDLEAVQKKYEELQDKEAELEMKLERWEELSIRIEQQTKK